MLGASGVIGSALVSELARGGSSPCPPAERPSGALAADIIEPSGARRARSKAPRSSSTSCTRSGSPSFEGSTGSRHKGSRARSRGRGVRQIVYLGGLGDDHPGLSPHLHSRRETAEALASGAVPVTTLRAAMVVGVGSAFERSAPSSTACPR